MRLLLHICCGPCALYPIKKLSKARFSEIKGFYYNPNIHPPSEYKRRRDTLKDAEKSLGFSVVYPDYKMEDFFKNVNSLEVPKARCKECWKLRLLKTAEYAKNNDFNAFTTSLLISPYQDHEAIKDIGEEIARGTDIEFYYEDFRTGFKESQEEAKSNQFYRQKYCGCVFSELERVKV
ncbi:MAG: epoxyqueuosine reductase QueH [Candidatus Omnitrophota bacterium]